MGNPINCINFKIKLVLGTEKVKTVGKSEPLLLVLSSKAENKANIALTLVTLYPTIFLLFQDYFYKVSKV